MTIVRGVRPSTRPGRCGETSMLTTTRVMGIPLTPTTFVSMMCLVTRLTHATPTAVTGHPRTGALPMMTPSERTILLYLCDAIEAAPKEADRLVEIVQTSNKSGLFLQVLDLFRGHIEARACARMIRVLIS